MPEHHMNKSCLDSADVHAGTFIAQMYLPQWGEEGGGVEWVDHWFLQLEALWNVIYRKNHLFYVKFIFQTLYGNKIIWEIRTNNI